MGVDVFICIFLLLRLKSDHYHKQIHLILNPCVLAQFKNVQICLSILYSEAMDAVYKIPARPAGTDEIAIELYSKYKMTEDVKAELAHHVTSKLPKPKGNKLLLIGPKVDTTSRLMEPLCSQIDIVSEEKYVPLLEALLVKEQDVEYTYSGEGNIGETFLIPKRKSSHCKFRVIEVSKFRDFADKDTHYDIVLLQNVIVHPEINILKQLMRLRHDALITMIVPGKLAHEGLFELLSGIEKNILHVFYNQAVHERTDYVRYITKRRQEINVWEIFVWIKKNAEDVREELKKVSQILQDEVDKAKVSSQSNHLERGQAMYDRQDFLRQFIDLHYGTVEHFGTKNFPSVCAHKVIEAATTANITGRVLDAGCAVGRTTIQLAHHFNQVVGVDFYANFINNANKFLHERYQDVAGKVKFVQADPTNIGLEGKFDVVFSGNLIERLAHPAAFLKSVVSHMNQKSLLCLASSYNWFGELTTEENWIGGRQINGADVSTYEGIKQILTGLGFKQFKNPESVRFALEQNPWVYQSVGSELTYWVRN